MLEVPDNNSKGEKMKLTESQKNQIMRAGGNAGDIAATERGEVEWDWEMLAS